MRLQGREISPTRASQLALHDEQKLVQEGYEFLDEKRMLLAQEILRQLQAYKALDAICKKAHKQARDRLVAASMRHGLEELSLYPPPVSEALKIHMEERNFIGFSLVKAVLQPEFSGTQDHAPQAFFPSIEAVECASAFRELISTDVQRAAISANLHRLIQEYTSTERRARALENVLLPEIAMAVKHIGESLEAGEQEEALQVRYAKAQHPI